MSIALLRAPRTGASVEAEIITRTHKVPALVAGPGAAGTITQQLDAVLATIGFKLSTALAAHLSGKNPGAVHAEALRILTVVRGMVGAHVEHNAYFIDFPFNVPDTREFWADCLAKASGAPGMKAVATKAVLDQVNLLALPTYGAYQHTYAEMLTRHDELIAALGDRLTVLGLGADLLTEAHLLFESLASSVTPLSPADLELVTDWAPFLPAPAELPPVRETRAVINAARLTAGLRPAVDAVTDILRMACAASGGDPTLETVTRFRSFTRPERRVLMAALDHVVRVQPSKVADIGQYRERWKRLGERLHPHEYGDFVHARYAFDVACGVVTVRTLTSRVQHAFDAGDLPAALHWLSQAPGMLLRNTDRLLRLAGPSESPAVHADLRQAVGAASGRVLLGLREHLNNRRTSPGSTRVFANRKGRAWVTNDTREPLDEATVNIAVNTIGSELHRRLPHIKHLVVDPAVYGLALPLSGKSTAEGFGVLPRGSKVPIEGNLLRFFTYWRQTHDRTDYDLSTLLLDEDFNRIGHVSYTSLHHLGATHSGDIVNAPKGATEFIDIPLKRVGAAATYIVPQVNIFCGESFDEVAESMFGYMTRDGAQHGRPFEPTTVRTRSDMRGNGRVALPVVFKREGAQWFACWTHLYLKGEPFFNRVEENARGTSALMAGVVNRERMTVGKWLTWMASKAETVHQWGPGWTEPLNMMGNPSALPVGPVTYVGIEAPGWLPEGSDVITLNRLHELVVA
jgi:hypothetical protein